MDENEGDDDMVKLGTCCNCAARPATSIAMLNRRAPIAGTGWGCVVCGLPCDGAVAVLCDDCAESLGIADAMPRFVCVGFASDNRRTSYFDLPDEIFAHDAAKHMGDDA